ncbi:probable phospholipid-transporting ATPase 5 [Tanacetum coccineum]
MIAPLVFVVVISVLKEGVEKWRMILKYFEVSSRKAKVNVGNGIFIDRTWKLIHVEDVVKVNKNKYFPNDLLLLSSSYEDVVCYVETINPDGETNLKTKRFLECTLTFDHKTKFDKFKANAFCDVYDDGKSDDIDKIYNNLNGSARQVAVHEKGMWMTATIESDTYRPMLLQKP